jgi:transposase
LNDLIIQDIDTNNKEMGYSIDLREKVIDASEEGMTQADIEMLFGVSTGSIKRWKKLKAETGKLAPRIRTDESYDIILKGAS